MTDLNAAASIQVDSNPGSPSSFFAWLSRVIERIRVTFEVDWEETREQDEDFYLTGGCCCG